MFRIRVPPRVLPPRNRVFRRGIVTDPRAPDDAADLLQAAGIVWALIGGTAVASAAWMLRGATS